MLRECRIVPNHGITTYRLCSELLTIYRVGLIIDVENSQAPRPSVLVEDHEGRSFRKVL